MRRRSMAVLCGLSACATAPVARQRIPDVEYDVYTAVLAMLAEPRPHMVLVERTVPLPCPSGLCRSEISAEVWPELWADYVRNNQAAAFLDPERFPRTLATRFASREPQPPRDCQAHAWIALSRAGFSADSSLAMLDWTYDIDVGPTRGCGDRYGILTVLERQQDGRWEIISPRYLHPGGIAPLPGTQVDSTR